MRTETKISFFDGATVSIIGQRNRFTYTTEFIDADTGELVYKHSMPVNHWCQPNQRYYVKWQIEIYSDDPDFQPVHYTVDLTGRKVAIKFDSPALGDTLAWVPFISEFQKRHDCHIHVITEYYWLFDSQYDDIKFRPFPEDFSRYFAQYRVGIYFTAQESWRRDWNRRRWNSIQLAAIASDALGLPFAELKPKINFLEKPRPIRDKYVMVATKSTAKAKHWNNPTGWQETFDWLRSHDYRVFQGSKGREDSLAGLEFLPSYDIATAYRGRK